MKVTGVFCRLVCLLIVSLLIIPTALADKVDLSSLTDNEIAELSEQITQELVKRGIEKSATLPAGKYIAGNHRLQDGR